MQQRTRLRNPAVHPDYHLHNECCALASLYRSAMETSHLQGLLLSPDDLHGVDNFSTNRAGPRTKCVFISTIHRCLFILLHGPCSNTVDVGSLGQLNFPTQLNVLR